MPTTDPPDWALPLLLLGAFRVVIDELHSTLAQQGHPHARPVHGFALQAIARHGGTVSDLAGRLGVSKQAAAKTVASLERLRYVRRQADPSDGRRQQLLVTARGVEMLRLSADALADVRRMWIDTLGPTRYRTMERALAAVVGDVDLLADLDAPGWLTGTALNQ